jgi:hypothetical protein
LNPSFHCDSRQIAEVKGAAAEVESQIADLKHHVDEHRQQYK